MASFSRNAWPDWPEYAGGCSLHPKTWRFERALELDLLIPRPLPSGAYVRGTIPPDVLDGARPDLGDLRMVDGSGFEVPFRVFTDRSQLAASLAFTVASAGVDKDLPKPVTWWVLDFGYRNVPVQYLTLGVSAGADNSRREVAISASDDGESWRAVAAGEVHRFDTIFGLEENLTVAFPVVDCRYLRLAVEEAPEGLRPVTAKGFLPDILWKCEAGKEYRLFWGNPAAPSRDYAEAGLATISPFKVSVPGQRAFGVVIDHSPPATPPSFLTPGEEEPVTGPADPGVAYLLRGLLGLGVIGAALLIVRVFRALGEKAGREHSDGD